MNNNDVAMMLMFGSAVQISARLSREVERDRAPGIVVPEPKRDAPSNDEFLHRGADIGGDPTMLYKRLNISRELERRQRQAARQAKG